MGSSPPAVPCGWPGSLNALTSCGSRRPDDLPCWRPPAGAPPSLWPQPRGGPRSVNSAPRWRPWAPSCHPPLAVPAGSGRDARSPLWQRLSAPGGAPSLHGSGGMGGPPAPLCDAAQSALSATVESPSRRDLIGAAITVEEGHVRRPDTPGPGHDADEEIARPHGRIGEPLHLGVQEKSCPYAMGNHFQGGVPSKC